VVGNAATVMLVGNVVVFSFILRNSERMKVKENKPSWLVMHRRRKRFVHTVAFPNLLGWRKRRQQGTIFITP
jgi:hypothetical protein